MDQPLKVVLISTYELGRQPFGPASAAAWLRAEGAEITQIDLSRQPLDDAAVRAADLIALYLPMHTATRLAATVIEKVRALNPAAHLCAYGLYAPVNRGFLRRCGIQTVLGGEFESGLQSLAARLKQRDTSPQTEPEISLERLQFNVPDRSGQLSLDRYARLTLPDGSTRVVGYTEASRGCKHRCRHCPIVPVYNGAFRIVQHDIVLSDVRQQVASGAQHITFGDPDFFNGPTHAMGIVQALHREFPALSYDVTIKIEHLLKHAELIPVLRDVGCAFVTSAVESLDDRVLALLEKGHTRADLLRVVELFRAAGLYLVPTFVVFTPWTTRESVADLMITLAELELVDQVAPVQLALRLLIPAGSRLLELEEVRAFIGEFDAEKLVFPWKHPDPPMDELQRRFETTVQRMTKAGACRRDIFAELWGQLQQTTPKKSAPRPMPALPARASVPYLTEPWYC